MPKNKLINFFLKQKLSSIYSGATIGSKKYQKFVNSLSLTEYLNFILSPKELKDRMYQYVIDKSICRRNSNKRIKRG